MSRSSVARGSESEAASYRLLMLMFTVASGVLGLISMLLVAVIVPPSGTTASGTKVDVIGAVLFAPAIAAILFGLSRARQDGPSPSVLGSVLGGVAALLVWVWWELRVDSPIINIRYFANRKLALTMLVLALLGLGVYSGISLMSPLLLQGPVTAAIGVGLTATSYGLVSAVDSILAFALLALAFPVINKILPATLVLLALLSLGSMFLVTAIPNLVVEAVPAANTSEFIGVSSVARNVMMAVGTVVIATHLTSGQPLGAPTSVASWTVASIWVLTVLAIALAVAFQIRRTVPGVEGESVAPAAISAVVPS